MSDPTYRIELRLTEDRNERYTTTMVLPEGSDGESVYFFLQEMLSPFRHLVNIEFVKVGEVNDE